MKMTRNTWFAGFFIISSFLVPLALFELYLRARGINATYIEKIDGGAYQSPYATPAGLGWLHIYLPHEVRQLQAKEFAIQVHANAEGCNDAAWSLQKNKKRILCLGDSFTEGIGALPDSSYPAVLQRLLGDSAEVCNAGISGSDPFFEYMLLKQKLLPYKPDVVLVSINLSDIDDYLARGGFERFRPDGTLSFNQAPWWEGLYARCYTFRFFMINVCHYSPLFLSPSQKVIQEDEARQQLIACVDSFSHLCRAQNIQPVFVFHPMISEVRENKLKCRPVLDYCRAQAIPSVDVLAYLRLKGVVQPEGIYWPIDQHHNNRGYHLLAEAVAENLRFLPD
ncbi:MAG: GDSL-type esterase/lipase family protein [Chitinophagales bacterium]